jgi:hypothetical protein
MNKFKLLYLIILISCKNPFVNARTSSFGSYRNVCMSNGALAKIETKYSVTKISDSTFHEAAKEMKNQRIEVRVIYFNEEPREIIGYTDGAVRYAFNPKISTEIVDGVSNELSEKERCRILNRFQYVIMQYQCEEGKIEAQKFIDENNKVIESMK